MEYEEICNAIFDLDEKIRFVAIYSKDLNKIAGGMRDGLETLTPDSITRMTVEQSFVRWDTRLQMSGYIGMPKYAVAEYGKLKRFTFHLGGHKLLLVSTELGLSTDFLTEEVLKLNSF